MREARSDRIGSASRALSLSSLYPSAMTYRNQGDIVDYSNGQGLAFDHDDWSAVKSEMGHFSSLYTSPGMSLRSFGTSARRTTDMNLASPNEITPKLSKKIHDSKVKE